MDKQRPSTEVSSVFFPVSEIRKGAYVHVDVINNAMSGTDGHKIAGIIKSLSPEDQKNVAVSMEISPETSSEDREVFEKYGTMYEDNTIKMYGDDFVGLANEEIVPKALGFIEAHGLKWSSDWISIKQGSGMGVKKHPHDFWMVKDLTVVRDNREEVLYDKSGKQLASQEFKSRRVTIVDKKLAVKVLQKLDSDAEVSVTLKAPAEPSEVEKLKSFGFIDAGDGNLAASQIKAKDALSLISNHSFEAFIEMILAQHLLTAGS